MDADDDDDDDDAGLVHLFVISQTRLLFLKNIQNSSEMEEWRNAQINLKYITYAALKTTCTRHRSARRIIFKRWVIIF